ncbi:MAG: DUF4238 domain-containing protein [Patescibacteria group bacterium]
MYQRGEEPIFTNKNNIAKEKHLYSFANTDGSYNTELESVLAEMEDIAGPIIERLNNATQQIIITPQEKSELSYFLAMQVVRTPGFRALLKKQAAEMAKLHMQMLASNKEAFAHSLKKVQEENPDTPEVSVEEMQDFVLDDSKYTIEMGNEDYFLKQAIELGDHIYPAIMMKDIFILKSKSVEFITSDYPVALIPNPALPPFYGGGFLSSGVLIPIGTHTVLFCKNPEEPKELPKQGGGILVARNDVSSAHVEWVNDVAIKRAERFLFSAAKDLEVKNKFDKTSPPERFCMTSPFSKKEFNNS